jgi:serine/threonine protein kinase
MAPSAVPPPNCPQPGEIIDGKYQVDRFLGAGGMGIVVAARHLRLGHLVAIKLLSEHAAATSVASERFLREARAAVAIQSEHVAKVLDSGAPEGGSPYIVMEYLIGLDLAQLTAQCPQLPIHEAIDYVVQACDAVAEAHAMGIVHRDLKPSNLFLTRRRDGSALVKVLDFGIAKMSADTYMDSTLTETGAVMGSPRYMAPEYLRDPKTADARADIWALGVVLYELLTGTSPFEADSASGVLARIVSEAPLPPQHLRPDLPEPLARTILRCLDKSPEARLQSIDELAAQLAPFAESARPPSLGRAEFHANSTNPEMDGRFMRRSRVWVLGLVAIAAVPLGALAVREVQGSREDPARVLLRGAGAQPAVASSPPAGAGKENAPGDGQGPIAATSTSATASARTETGKTPKVQRMEATSTPSTRRSSIVDSSHPSSAPSSEDEIPSTRK